MECDRVGACSRFAMSESLLFGCIVLNSPIAQCESVRNTLDQDSAQLEMYGMRQSLKSDRSCCPR